MQENWSLIDQHGADIVRFGDVQELKNDVKIKDYIVQCWNEYMSKENEVEAKDNTNAIKHCNDLLYWQLRQKEDVEQIERRKQKIIDQNELEKDEAFQTYIKDKFEIWKGKPE